MVSTTKRLSLAGAVLVAFTPFCTHAAGFYVDAGIGSSSIGGLDKQDLDATMVALGEDTFDSFELNDSNVDKSDVGFSLALGYRLTDYFGVEAAFLQLGKTSYEADVTVADGANPPVDLTMGLGFKSSGPALSLVGFWPIGERVALEGRAGAYFAKTKATVSVTDGVIAESESLGSESDTSLLLGIGATWSMTQNLGLRLGYTRIDGAVAGEGNAGILSLGVRFSF